MDAEREAILQVYAATSEEAIGELEACLLALEQHPQRTDVLNEAFRLCHTIKGDAKTVGFAAATELAHTIEEVFDRLRAGSETLEAGLVSALLRAVDSLAGVIRESLAGREVAGDALEEMISRHRRELGVARRGTRAPEGDAQRKATGSAESSPADVARADAREGDNLFDRRHGGLRVRIDVLDRLLDLTGELSIARNHMGMLISQEGELCRASLRDAQRDLDLLLGELQEEVMQARMVPIGPVFRQHMRTVRDLAHGDNKRAVLEISGATVELDTTVVDHVRECLGHVIRNAVCHGIEGPDERIRKGKDPCGRVELTARHEDGFIVVDVTDDGRGFDRDAILARAETMGIAPAERGLPDGEIFQLVFAAGLSTREESNLASGRGVGMDVVRSSLEALGGTVRIASGSGEGATVSLRLPLTLAIIEGFEVVVGGETYVIPLASVVECVDLEDVESAQQASGVTSLRGRPLPYVRLRSLFRIPGTPPTREAIVVVHDGALQAGIAVDALRGESQAVIKPLARVFRDVPGVAGSTIQASGAVALILDVPGLLQLSQRRRDARGGTPGTAWVGHA